MTTEKIDIFKLHKGEYKAGGKPEIVRTTKAMHLAVEGQGAPGGEDFQNAINALYSMAYTIKMGRKADGKGDYTISKLEGIYRTADGSDLDSIKKEKWCWQLLIRTPEKVGTFPITDEDLLTARNRLKERKKDEGCDKVVLHHLEAGQYVQMLHVGPYENERESLALMLKFCEDQGMEKCGPHHEIYLSDPRRVKPENLKTILRIKVQ